MQTEPGKNQATTPRAQKSKTPEEEPEKKDVNHVPAKKSKQSEVATAAKGSKKAQKPNAKAKAVHLEEVETKDAPKKEIWKKKRQKMMLKVVRIMIKKRKQKQMERKDSGKDKGKKPEKHRRQREGKEDERKRRNPRSHKLAALRGKHLKQAFETKIKPCLHHYSAHEECNILKGCLKSIHVTFM